MRRRARTGRPSDSKVFRSRWIRRHVTCTDPILEPRRRSCQLSPASRSAGALAGMAGRGPSYKAARLAGSRGRRSFGRMNTTTCITALLVIALLACRRRDRRRTAAGRGCGAVRPEGLQPQLATGDFAGARDARPRRAFRRRAWPARRRGPAPPAAPCERPTTRGRDRSRLRRRLPRGGVRGDVARRTRWRPCLVPRYPRRPRRGRARAGAPRVGVPRGVARGPDLVGELRRRRRRARDRRERPVGRHVRRPVRARADAGRVPPCIVARRADAVRR